MNYQKTQNYQKTRQFFESTGEGLKYEKPPHEKKEERWYETTSNPRTGQFLQWADLRQIGIDPLMEKIDIPSSW